MPELPEVEVVRRALAPRVEGRRILRCTVLDGRLTAPHGPGELTHGLEGRRITALGRRGKYLVFSLDDGATLAAHLRMTGMFRLAAAGEPPERARATLCLDDGVLLAFTDTRRFGTWELLPGRAAADGFFAARLGPDALDPALTGRVLRGRLRGRRAPLKAALLDQRVLAGLGNVYVDESLHAARLSPLRTAGGLRPPEAERLLGSARAILESAIALGGSSIRDYSSPDGAAGRAQEAHRVYGRAGRPCPRCGRTLAGGVVGGRSSTWCRSCQRAPRRRAAA